MSEFPLSFIPMNSEALAKVLDRYKGLPHENLITDFESAIKEFTNATHVVALNSGTAAIHLALKAVGVGQDDEVLVSTFTYVATVNPILYLGAKPVFIEVEEGSWNMDPSILEVAITSRLRQGKKPGAILVVHTYGMPARMKEIMEISERYEIPVVEDAAEALGSRIGSQPVGTFGKIGVLSFNNNKILTTYGGGAILTEDADLAQKIAFWAGQSRESKLYYEHKELGYNYRMGPINAAVGLSKISGLAGEILERRCSFEVYKRLLGSYGIKFQMESPDYFSNRWLSACTISDLNIDFVSKSLQEKGIETRPVWNPMHKQPLFSSFNYFKSEPVSELLFSRSLCFPFGGGETETIANSVSRILGYKV